MNEPLISIIVPIYNVENFLDRCINSIVSQTYQMIELLLVDDGSTDQSAAMCAQWAGKDHRIKYYRKENSGVSAARNLGLNYATGQFVTFVDADDYLKPTHIEKMLTLQKTSGADIVVTNATDIYEDGRTVINKSGAKDKLLNHDEAIWCFLEGKLFAPVCWGRLYKKSSIASVRFDENMRIAEDGKFFLDAIEHSHIVYFLAENSYFYVVHTGSVMHSGFNEKYYDELRFCEELVARYEGQKKLDTAARIKRCLFIIRLLRMPGLPTADYRRLLSKAKQYYSDVKTHLSIKDHLKFLIFANASMRTIFLKVMP